MMEAALTLKENKEWSVEGELTFATVTQVLKQSKKLWEDLPHITVDFSKVNAADSAALALMIEWQRIARKSRKRISFLNLPPQLKKLTQMSELKDILNFD